jgi:hypothetical protein
MASRTRQGLDVQVQTLIDAAEAATNWFRRPGPDALTAARVARDSARSWETAERSLALAEAVESATRSVADAALWEFGADAQIAAMSEALRDGSTAFQRAARAQASARAAALLEAKAFAAAVERGRRIVVSEAHSSDAFIDSIKRSEIAARLSASAEALQQACDALTRSLSQ